MKIFFSFIINILLSLVVITSFYSYSASGAFAGFLILACVISLVLLGAYNKKIHVLILLSFAYIFVLSVYHFSSTKQIQISSQANQQQAKIEIASSTNSFDNMVQDLEIKIRNNESNEEIIKYVKNILNVTEAKLDNNNPKSYVDVAKAREIEYALKLKNDRDYVLSAYYAYCALSPNDPECYAMIARFLITDQNKKQEAVAYAEKALQLARDKNEIEVYNALVEYILKL